MNVEEWNLTEEQRARYCSEARLRQARSMHGERQKRLCLGAEVLLNRSLEIVGRAVSLPAVYRRNEHGKPYLVSAPDLYVNWSHSGSWVLCAVSDTEVGVDLQSAAKEPKDALIRRFLQPEEREYYDRVPEEQRRPLFYRYWVVKESYLKALGSGFCTPLDTFYVKMGERHPEIIPREAEELCTCRILKAPDRMYAAAVCVRSAKGEIPGEVPVEILL